MKKKTFLPTLYLPAGILRIGTTLLNYFIRAIWKLTVIGDFWNIKTPAKKLLFNWAFDKCFLKTENVARSVTSNKDILGRFSTLRFFYGSVCTFNHCALAIFLWYIWRCFGYLKNCRYLNFCTQRFYKQLLKRSLGGVSQCWEFTILRCLRCLTFLENPKLLSLVKMHLELIYLLGQIFCNHLKTRLVLVGPVLSTLEFFD